MPVKDPLSRVLYIDLTLKRFWVEDRRDLFDKYLGGTGVAVSLLREELPRGADPLSPDNVVVFSVGPFNGVYPMASKTVAVFKSPLNSNLGESHAGGRSSVAIRLAGYGAIVIKGASDAPVWVSIQDNRVQFRDARALWGVRSTHTVGRVLREVEGGHGFRSIMRIGRAGEKMVRYACVVVDTFRHFGRLGLGAVFGSKKLKALVVIGKHSIPVVDKPAYRRVYDKIFKSIMETPATRKYHELGTSENVLPLNALGALPTMNLKQARFNCAEEISGEHLAAKFLGRRVSCAHCPVACIHLAALREPYDREPYFYKTTFVPYDYEPIYSLGSMLGVCSTTGLLKLLDKVEALGLDAMSTGVALAWTTEAFERGLITENDTMGVKPTWGDYENYLKIIELLVDQPNEFYATLARGTEYAAKVYGGEDFALTYGGNEMPGYHTGPAAHLGFATGARHSHLDSAGYSYDQKTVGKTIKVEDMVDYLINEERWRQVLTSLVICLFARGIYTPQVVVEGFRPLGVELSESDLLRIGREIHLLKLKFKLDEGFNFSQLRFPKRIFETSTPHGRLDPSFMDTALKLYQSKIEEDLQKFSSAG
ncbi:MAG: aldehyde ferredoxin oxidoreductase family protein [Thermofilaceae archaeon]|nr:aldehyde ferredoxin oxidoreductase family protein [Thermofilaceae archaeon]MCX8180459.1 aldehyde ferredoxin oxidoreductase family protein [Thermofilaceae archaeon]MDW8003343.1 aldehyde ferredoxin oxidoreductase family protein [Thermofilaceae archaeon]